MQAADAPRVAELSGQLGYPATVEQIAARFQAIGQRPDEIVLVAVTTTDTGAADVAGWLHLLTAGYLQSEPYAEIGGLVVDERYRGQGIGEELVRAAEEWTARQGFQELKLRSNAKRLRAHAFYQRLGYSVFKQSLQFSKQIGIDNSRDNE